MNRYGNKLENLKMAFFDVDNTLLCLKMYDDNGNRIIGVAHPDDWLRYRKQCVCKLCCSESDETTRQSTA